MSNSKFQKAHALKLQAAYRRANLLSLDFCFCMWNHKLSLKHHYGSNCKTSCPIPKHDLPTKKKSSGPMGQSTEYPLKQAFVALQLTFCDPMSLSLSAPPPDVGPVLPHQASEKINFCAREGQTTHLLNCSVTCTHAAWASRCRITAS